MPASPGEAAVPAALVLLTRVPVPGRVKTRLLPSLPPEGCAGLQHAMACDAAAALGTLGLPLTVRWSDEAEGLPGGTALCGEFVDELTACARRAGAPSVRSLSQQGAGLGPRMAGALEAELASGAAACLLMGSDLPTVDAATLRAAWDAFEAAGPDGTPADVLFCPSSDGGYWLVGLRAPFPALFEGRGYGTGRVLDEALSACFAAGRTVALGPVVRDVDTPDDLAWLSALVAAGDERVGTRTTAWMRSHGLVQGDAGVEFARTRAHVAPHGGLSLL